jgi:hypothetical protein
LSAIGSALLPGTGVQCSVFRFQGQADESLLSIAILILILIGGLMDYDHEQDYDQDSE